MKPEERAVIILACVLLIIGGISSAYVYYEENESEEIFVGGYIVIKGSNMTLHNMFEGCPQREVITNRGEYNGVALSCVINLSLISNPEEYEYTIIASDKYEKTVYWEDMTKGILTENRMTVFPHLPGAFWVKNVVEIEVI
jgi:hypothetical protein